MLNRNGKVLLVTGPAAPSDVRLRRAQALALGNGVGLEICRRLIDAKLEGQERVIRERLNDSATADAIGKFRDRLAGTDSIEAVRVLEAHAAVAYFGAWRNVPVFWPKVDMRRIPDHWRTVGGRHSPLSGGPRLAVTPAHAILNYCFGLLESETRLSVTALGLDPGLGVGLHTDTPNRDSLALDVLEPIRPQIEAWLLDWIMREPLRRSDFFETATGNCRLVSQFCAKLSETAPTWAKLIAPWAEYVAHTLWARSQARSRRSLPTPLTQQHRREAKGCLSSLPPIASHLARPLSVALRNGNQIRSQLLSLLQFDSCPQVHDRSRQTGTLKRAQLQGARAASREATQTCRSREVLASVRQTGMAYGEGFSRTNSASAYCLNSPGHFVRPRSLSSLRNAHPTRSIDPSSEALDVIGRTRGLSKIVVLGHFYGKPNLR